MWSKHAAFGKLIDAAHDGMDHQPSGRWAPLRRSGGPMWKKVFGRWAPLRRSDAQLWKGREVSGTPDIGGRGERATIGGGQLRAQRQRTLGNIKGAALSAGAPQSAVPRTRANRETDVSRRPPARSAFVIFSFCSDRVARRAHRICLNIGGSDRLRRPSPQALG